jgi:DNA-binding transcriptional MocR family regulator
MSPGATMELVYSELKAKIMRGDFAPGERLEPAQLAKQLGVSPTPVRDALYRLSGERLIEAWRHEGFRQPILAEADLHDLYAWAASLLALALDGQPPDPQIPQRSFSDSGAQAYSERVAALFRAIAWTSTNRELRFAIVSLIERCHVFRLAEARVDQRCDPAIVAMDDDFRFGRWSALRSKITRFHRRRIVLAGRVVAELRPREEAL